MTPHAVHLKDPVISEPDLDEDGKPVMLEGIAQVTRRLSEAASSCPDCHRATHAGNDAKAGYFLTCPQVPVLLPDGVKPCHEGCLIACGEGV